MSPSFLSRCCTITLSGLCVSLVLLACSSQPTLQTSGPRDAPAELPTKPRSIYTADKDGAPLIEVDVSQIPDAVPKPELVTQAGNKTPYSVLGKTYHVNFNTKGYKETGIGSWYGTKFHDFNTSNGELYDMLAMTGAHKTLAIPTYVRVQNLENGRSVVVRINDRGPFHDGRVIDLSYAAAKKLGYHRKGTARVSLEVLAPTTTALPTPLAPGTKYFQVGAFKQEATALAVKQLLKTTLGEKIYIKSDMSLSLYKVLVGPISLQNEMLSIKEILAKSGYSNAYLVTLK
jgi:rare lipoprotein A